jgi:hypothetical protein
MLRALVGIGLAGAAAAFGTVSSFSASTSNPDDLIATGTVAIADNDSDTAMYSLSNAKPGTTVDRCIKVTYTGSLDADVKLYAAGTVAALGPYVDLQITPGTQASSTFADCTGFVADAGGAIFNGTLDGFFTTKTSYATGIAFNPGGATKWAQNNTAVFRFRVTVQDNQAAAGKTTGLHGFTWEARNQ